MIYKEKFKIGLKDVWRGKEVNNRAILEYLENIGSYHSDLAGFGANDTQRTKVTWILLDWKLKVLDRPKYGEILEIHTWGREMCKFFTYRDFEIYNCKGELCAIATSKWALVNIENGKLERITENVIDIAVLLVFSLIVWLFAATKKSLNRLEGFIMLALYAAYSVYIFVR